MSSSILFQLIVCRPVGSAGGAAPAAVFLCPAQPPWGLRMLQPGARHGGKR